VGICNSLPVLDESPGTDRALLSSSADLFRRHKSVSCDGGLCCLTNPPFHLDSFFSKIPLQHSMEYGTALIGQCFLEAGVFVVSLVI
jgi:hypothetical protein